MNLGDIKIIDLKASTLDEKLSKPDQSVYVFKSKRYISYNGKGPRPDYWFRWIRHEKNNNFREENVARVDGYSYVLAGVDPYWPESVPHDGNGQYVYGDVVLMKRPLMMELDARLENAKTSKGMANSTFASLKTELQGDCIPQSMIDDLIGK